MAKRPTLKGNVQTAQAAADVARKLTKAAPQVSTPDPDELTLTASYVLPERDVDMLAELAALRLERDKMESRAYRRAVAAARKAGTAPPQAVQQARRSASAIVREAIDAHRPAILAEINELRDALGR